MYNEDKCNFCQEILINLDALRDHYCKSHRVDISNPVFKEYGIIYKLTLNCSLLKLVLFVKRNF